MPVKLIDSTHYHLWSDALHARELARTATDEWDRGAYVRWAVNTAWTAFESYASDVLGADDLGIRFRERFTNALASKSLPSVTWGLGIWQRVLSIYEARKEFTHVAPMTAIEVLRPPTAVAETAIITMREAVRALAALVNVPSPAWVEDDTGAPFSVRSSVSADLTVLRPGADPNDPDTIRITYEVNGKETVHEYAPPGTPWEPMLDSLEKALNVPASAVRAYRGPTLLAERKLSTRRSGG